MVMMMSEKKDIRPVFIKFGVALVFSLGGILYTILRNKKNKPSRPPSSEPSPAFLKSLAGASDPAAPPLAPPLAADLVHGENLAEEYMLINVEEGLLDGENLAADLVHGENLAEEYMLINVEEDLVDGENLTEDGNLILNVADGENFAQNGDLVINVEQNLDQHEVDILQNNWRRLGYVLCLQCWEKEGMEYQFSRIWHIETHNKIHHKGRLSLKYICGKCGNDLRAKQFLETHSCTVPSDYRRTPPTPKKLKKNN